MLVRIANSGNAPVVAADYESPIRLSLGSDARIFTADVVEAKPANLTVSPTIEGADVVVSPVLLNPGDSVTLQMLAQSEGGMTVGARIVGVSQIEDAAARGRKRREYFAFLGELYAGCFSVWMGVTGLRAGLDIKGVVAACFFICVGALILMGLLAQVLSRGRWSLRSYLYD
jgi:amino acid transporter